MLAAVLAAAGSAGALAEEDSPMDRTVTVSASAEIAATPDIARIATGVTTEAATAREALSRNNEAMSKVVEGLKSAGIEPKDIQTGSFNVEPRYTSPRDNQPPVIDGYRVTNQVNVTARDLGRLGEVLDRLVTLGANQVHGLAFEVSKAETLKDDARREAMANAHRRAKLYAEAAGASVGEVVAIAEDAAAVAPRPYAMGRMAASAVPIEAGSVELSARVTVTWSLK
jgi:uncharacterized protein YggE